MRLHYTTLSSDPQRDKMIELTLQLIGAEDLGLDDPEGKLFKVYVVDELNSKRDGWPLAGLISGSLERGYSVRIKAARSPRKTFLCLIHELKHIHQAMYPKSRNLSDEFLEKDAANYARLWDYRLPPKADTYEKINAWLRQLDNALLQQAKQHARQWHAARKEPKKFNAQMIERASLKFAPRTHAGREHAITRHGVEYR